MESEKKLVKLWSFWIALLTPPFFSIVIVITLNIHNNLLWDYSISGILCAIDYFGVPLSIAALSFPCVALVTANHRSAQASQQLISQKEQNNFSNYFFHREQFDSFASEVATKKSHINVELNGFKLYKQIFFKSSITQVDVKLPKGCSDHLISSFEKLVFEPCKSMGNIEIEEFTLWVRYWLIDNGIEVENINIQTNSDLDKYLFSVSGIFNKLFKYGEHDSKSMETSKDEDQKIIKSIGQFRRWIKKNPIF